MGLASRSLQGAVALALFAACGAAGAQTIFRCTAADGSVSIQQTPCPGSSKTDAIKAAPPVPASPRRVAAPGAVSPVAPEAKRHWLVWSGDPAIDAVRASANLDSIRTLGRICEGGLRAGSKDGDACQRFLAQLAPGGDYARVMDKVRDLSSSSVTLQSASVRELRRAESINQDIVGLHEFVKIAIGRQ